jgi:hypothetical protein
MGEGYRGGKEEGRGDGNEGGWVGEREEGGYVPEARGPRPAQSAASHRQIWSARRHALFFLGADERDLSCQTCRSIGPWSFMVPVVPNHPGGVGVWWCGGGKRGLGEAFEAFKAWA